MKELKPWQKAKSEQECFEEMENDVVKFPLPVRFDDNEEIKEFNRRYMRIKFLSRRYYRRFLAIPKQPIKQQQ